MRREAGRGVGPDDAEVRPESGGGSVEAFETAGAIGAYPEPGSTPGAESRGEGDGGPGREPDPESIGESATEPAAGTGSRPDGEASRGELTGAGAGIAPLTGSGSGGVAASDAKISCEGLEAEGLVKSYRGRRVVDRVSFVVRPGEVVGLLGPNGAGKTTTFSMAVGLLKPEAGRVVLGGVDLTRQPIHLRARQGLGYLPQESSVFRRLTVRDNLLAVLELDPALNRRKRLELATSLIEEFELTRVARSLGEQLSGGERRRLEIARCLATRPRIVLLDEPFAGIDPLAVAEIQGLIGRLVARRIGVLITDHNVRETLGICSRAYILVAGRVVEEGPSRKVAESPRARTLYLGEGFRL